LEKTTSRIRGSTPEIELNARNLRQNLTPAEQILWQHLRNRKLHGLKFRRQHPIGRFIVDFYCPEYRLIVELDGEIHDRQVEYDMARTEQLQADGDRVLRFQNQEVLDRLSWVLEQILQGLHSQP
jgi:very-short-patch-repair endonuclease